MNMPTQTHDDDVRCTCGAAMVPLIYGYPSKEQMRKADLGEVVLMGCVIREQYTAKHYCRECGRYSYD